jgi:hypothetical protein
VFFIKGNFVTEINVEEIHMSMRENIPSGRSIKTGEIVMGEESRERGEKWI